MKNGFRKILSLILALAMVLSAAVSAAAATPKDPLEALRKFTSKFFLSPKLPNMDLGLQMPVLAPLPVLSVLPVVSLLSAARHYSSIVFKNETISYGTTPKMEAATVPAGLDYITVIIGKDTDRDRFFNLSIPKAVQDLMVVTNKDGETTDVYEYLESIFGEGLTVGALKDRLRSAAELLSSEEEDSTLAQVFSNIASAVGSVPEFMDSAVLSLGGAPKDAGVYWVYVVTADPRYFTSADQGSIVILKKGSKAELIWNEEMPEGGLSYAEAQAFNFGASFYRTDLEEVMDADSVNIRAEYTGKSADGRLLHSSTPIREAGRFTETISVIGGNYKAEPIVRTYTVAKPESIDMINIQVKLINADGAKINNVEALKAAYVPYYNKTDKVNVNISIDGAPSLTADERSKLILSDADGSKSYKLSASLSAQDKFGHSIVAESPVTSFPAPLALELPTGLSIPSNATVKVAALFADGSTKTFVKAASGSGAVDGNYILDGNKLTVYTSKPGTFSISYTVPSSSGSGETYYSYPPKKEEKITYSNCPKNDKCILAPYKDLVPTEWYHDGIHFCLEYGLMHGYSKTEFRPNGYVTRQQVWIVLANLAGAELGSIEAARTWAMTNGISDGSNPTAPVSRQQLAVMLYSFAKKLDLGYKGDWMYRLPYTDETEVGVYAYEAVCWCNQNRIFGGYSDGSLRPGAGATRAHFAIMTQRFVEYILSQDKE